MNVLVTFRRNLSKQFKSIMYLIKISNLKSSAGAWQSPPSSSPQGNWSSNYSPQGNWSSSAGPGPNWTAPPPQLPPDPTAGSSSGSSLNAFAQLNLGDSYTTPAINAPANTRFFGSALPSPLVGPSPSANSTPGDFYLSLDHRYLLN